MTSPRTTGVWISANSATVLRWSLAPAHRLRGPWPAPLDRTTTDRGHQGGEGHRDEHMRTFLDQVAHAVPVDDDLLLVSAVLGVGGKAAVR